MQEIEEKGMYLRLRDVQERNKKLQREAEVANNILLPLDLKKIRLCKMYGMKNINVVNT